MGNGWRVFDRLVSILLIGQGEGTGDCFRSPSHQFSDSTQSGVQRLLSGGGLSGRGCKFLQNISRIHESRVYLGP